MTLFFILWAGLLGTAVGSFLNVVVWRLPRGNSLVSPPSHCPKCGHPIRVYDNLPVLGWCFLGGKCRDCHESISFRYPLIELLCGITFAMATAFVLMADCPTSFPTSVPPSETGEVARVLFTNKEEKSDDITGGYGIKLWVSALFCVFLATLLAAGLIEYDKNTLSAKLFAKLFSPFVCFCGLSVAIVSFLPAESVDRIITRNEMFLLIEFLVKPSHLAVSSFLAMMIFSATIFVSTRRLPFLSLWAAIVVAAGLSLL